MEYQSAIKIYKLPLYTITYESTKLRQIMLNEKSETQKNIYVVILFT